jgi:hypothetical protein
MKISVTAEDIFCGSQETGQRMVTHCAVARALRRRFPKSKIVVGFSFFNINGKRGLLSKTVEKKVYAIMDQKTVKPFSFPLPKLQPRGAW